MNNTRMYELQTGLDLNNDGLKTFVIDGASSSLNVDFSNRGSNNETGRYTHHNRWSDPSDQSNSAGPLDTNSYRDQVL